MYTMREYTLVLRASDNQACSPRSLIISLGLKEMEISSCNYTKPCGSLVKAREICPLVYPEEPAHVVRTQKYFISKN